MACGVSQHKVLFHCGDTIKSYAISVSYLHKLLLHWPSWDVKNIRNHGLTIKNDLHWIQISQGRHNIQSKMDQPVNPFQSKMDQPVNPFQLKSNVTHPLF